MIQAKLMKWQFRQQITLNVVTIMSKIVRLCDHGWKVKFQVGYLAFKYYGGIFLILMRPNRIC